MLNAKRRLLCQRRGSQSLIVLMPQEEIEKRFSHNIVSHVELSKAIKYKQHYFNKCFIFSVFIARMILNTSEVFKLGLFFADDSIISSGRGNITVLSGSNISLLTLHSDMIS